MSNNYSPGLYNLFSNIWFFFGYNNQEHDHILKKVKAIHGITKLISIDDLCRFWIQSPGGGTNQGETFEPTIRQQIIIDRRAKLIKVYKHIAQQIDTAIIANNSEASPTVLCIYSLNTSGFECLIGSYLYYLNTRASMTLANAARSLSSKISGVEYQMTEEMKQFLFLVCSSTN